MPNFSLGLIIVSVCLSAVAQLLLKKGMSSMPVQRALAEADAVGSLWAILTSYAVISGLVVYFGSALVWLFVLSRVEVSVAYPFVALGFILTAIAGQMFFGEALTMVRVVGIGLVCLGVAVLARG